jgi:hypothetical protein
MVYDLCLYLYLYLQFSKNNILHPSSCSYDIGSGSYSDSKFNYTVSELFLLVILTLSGIYVRVVNRQPQQKLGANGRDDGPLVSLFCFEACYYVCFLLRHWTFFYIIFLHSSATVFYCILYLLLTLNISMFPVNRLPEGGT